MPRVNDRLPTWQDHDPHGHAVSSRSSAAHVQGAEKSLRTDPGPARATERRARESGERGGRLCRGDSPALQKPETCSSALKSILRTVAVLTRQVVPKRREPMIWFGFGLLIRIPTSMPIVLMLSWVQSTSATWRSANPGVVFTSFVNRRENWSVLVFHCKSSSPCSRSLLRGQNSTRRLHFWEFWKIRDFFSYNKNRFVEKRKYVRNRVNFEIQIANTCDIRSMKTQELYLIC